MLKLLSLLTAFVFAAQACAETIVSLVPSEVEAFVSETENSGLVVVHYSSDDGSCSFCITNNSLFAAASNQLSGDFVFVQVIANPWNKLFEPPAAAAAFQSRIGYPLLGLPNVVVFKDGQPIAQLNGTKDDLIDKLRRLTGVQSTEVDTVDGGLVTQIATSDILNAARSLSARQPLLLTLSSPDLGCPPCISGNENLESIAPRHAEGWSFARVFYNPWTSVADDVHLQRFLATMSIEIKGLPTSLLIYKGSVVAQVTTTIDLDALLKQALPKILAMD